MKNTILLFSLCFVLSIANAQKKQNVYYLKNSGKEVDLKDSADYVRIIQEPDSGEVNFNLLEFYIDGKKKSLGKVSAFEPGLVFEGVVLRYDNDGKRKELTTYEKGMPKGTSYHYFSNGKLHKQIEYLAYSPPFSMPLPSVGAPTVPFNPNSKLIYFADSLGIELVKDGNGHYIETFKTPKSERTEEGDYKDGVKNGVWKGGEFGTSYIETYEMGKLMGGESTKEGVKYPYTNNGQPPSYKGGIKNFYEYLSYSIKYPSDAAKERITGTVFLSFTIEKDGRLTEVEVKKSVYPSLDYEAIRVVRNSPKWIPGTMRGLPVRVKYNIPIKFSIPR